MTVTQIVRTSLEIIDLDDVGPEPGGHRLVELVQVIAGCGVERAELALDDPVPDGPISAAQALDALSAAIVRLHRLPTAPRPRRAAPISR